MRQMSAEEILRTQYPVVLVILGAGASAPSGAPTFTNYSSLARRATRDPKARFALAVWSAYYDTFGLEDAITALRFHDRLGLRLPLFPGLKKRALKLRLGWGDDIDPAGLADLLERSVPETLAGTSDVKQVGQYERLADQLKETIDHLRERAANAVVVASFNWDTLFEIAAEGRIHLDTTGVHYGQISPETYARATLLKPHGSLNYHVCLGTPACRKRAMIERAGNLREWYEDGEPTVSVCEACKRRRDLFIFPPHYNKELPSKYDETPGMTPGKVYIKEWYARTWRDVYNAAKRCKAVISLGYSWPASDYPMRVQFAQGMKLNRHKPRLFIVSGQATSSSEWADRHAALRERVQTLLPATDGGGLTFAPVGIERFLEEKSLLERLRPVLE
jgi:NAD-dependent SIR2 family protein deacetylase